MASAFTLTLAYLGEECSAMDAGGAFAAYITGNVASNLVGRLISAGIADHFGLAANFYFFSALNLAGAVLVYFTVRTTMQPRTEFARSDRLLGVDRINTYYGKSHILNDVSFDVRKHEIVALLGRNGAGKSTLLKSLVGIARPEAGSIRLLDQETVGLSSATIARRGIGYVPQGRGLFAGMTVADNLVLGRLKRTTGDGIQWSDERIVAVFPRLAERWDTPADFLSGGEQQMVAVARALAGNVQVLLLDEPFEGLSPAVTQELFEVFDRLRHEGGKDGECQKHDFHFDCSWMMRERTVTGHDGAVLRCDGGVFKATGPA